MFGIRQENGNEREGRTGLNHFFGTQKMMLCTTIVFLKGKFLAREMWKRLAYFSSKMFLDDLILRMKHCPGIALRLSQTAIPQ